MRKAFTDVHAKLDPDHTALIVVDMQNDFLEDDGFLGKLGLDVATGRSLLPKLNEFVITCRQAGTMVVFLQEILTERTSLDNLTAQWGRWDAVVAEGSWGAELSRDLITRAEGEPLVVKHNYDGFEGTDLNFVLAARGIRTVLFSGVATNVCVETTARRAYGLGYHVVALTDLCASSSIPEQDAAIFNLKTYFGGAMTSAEVADIWHSRK